MRKSRGAASGGGSSDCILSPRDIIYEASGLSYSIAMCVQGGRALRKATLDEK